MIVHPQPGVYHRLDTHLGSNHVFLDVDNIDLGVDAIEKSVGSCDALIAVIGRSWLISADKEGRRRLDNPEDCVRKEIATALKHGVPVIPVLVDGAIMPRSTDLPDDLKALARRQALEIRRDRFNDDCRLLIAALERALHGATAEQQEKQRLEAERHEKERIEAKQRVEAEQREKQRLEAEQREKERVTARDQPSKTNLALWPDVAITTKSEGFLFVCYKREDMSRIKPILLSLRAWGCEVWYDKGIPGGAEWDAAIEERIKNCKLFLLFLSEASVDSKYVRREVRFADVCDKPIIGVKLERVTLAHGLYMLLQQYQMLDATGDEFTNDMRNAVQFHGSLDKPDRS